MPEDEVKVPADGTFLVRDGQVLPAEADLYSVDRNNWRWDVWTDPIEESE